MTQYIVPIAVGIIIVVQLYFFFKNLVRMREYRDIFSQDKSWGISHSQETQFVNGIYGKGNKVFDSVRDSINKYLRNNQGSVIDFQLLKDTVDRHCDSVENDVNTLTPTPLYCGLAGTMFGVIIGLMSLIQTDAIVSLLSGVDEEEETEIVSPVTENVKEDVAFSSLQEKKDTNKMTPAAEGVNELLTGVAWAMVASIVGILLTTASSILFKRYKLRGEEHKNTFLAWLQSRLLPELPSDTSEALNNLVKNLNKFNNTFASNTRGLGDTLKQVNESYRIQGDIVKAVHDMDVMKMAQANVRVLQELKECTDKLEQFQDYLDNVEEYTDALTNFTEKFETETERLHVLEEIRDFFARHKGEISKDVADSDKLLKSAGVSLRETVETNSVELQQLMGKQAADFRQTLKDEREAFEQTHKEIKEAFNKELSKIPALTKSLTEISAIPGQLDKLAQKLEDSNRKLAGEVALALTRANEKKDNVQVEVAFPAGLKWGILGMLLVMMLTIVGGTAYNIWWKTDQSPATYVPSNIQQPVAPAVPDSSSQPVPQQSAQQEPNNL